ncbi:HlyD family type I secretion periplasmic adaptor subunit [Roseateles cellulosilyticus]|uniref:Membrane fusion protein (MFP) family protein n=1 Tax=Pelomonas cellulosilytica TaxID=2906762 RepID=A0ABS8Y2J6_9BURK|nr:HlyD family type I secretion periplasmic adaptor subunit [Pelomonas sp. P8]MCE4556125.1 HlyD family type I secretion periplasmic adaptor subunit [Pelomonas sp. P8]
MAAARHDGMFTSALANALADEPLPRSMWALYLLAAALFAAVAWASIAKVDQLSRVQGRVVPEAREQVIASLDSGLLAELKVREGEEVQAGQELARLDPTRVEAQENEGALRRTAMRVAVARLRAEAYGSRFELPADVPPKAEAVQLERQAYEARQRLLDEAVSSLDRSIGLLAKELKVAQELSARGLMSEVEVMRVNRQINDLRQQRQERISRFRQDASQELTRQENELAALDEQQVVRQDAMKRTVLRSPVHGIVKNIRITTLGGVVGSGAPIMEIVPLGEAVLIEARVPPSEVGFIQVGQRAIMKITGYDYNINGGLEGRIETISADTLGDNEKITATGDARYYRALVRADHNTLTRNGKPLPVIPGMSATVEIKTGERTVLSFVLRPLMKSQEALKER